MAIARLDWPRPRRDRYPGLRPGKRRGRFPPAVKPLFMQRQGPWSLNTDDALVTMRFARLIRSPPFGREKGRTHCANRFVHSAAQAGLASFPSLCLCAAFALPTLRIGKQLLSFDYFSDEGVEFKTASDDPVRPAAQPSDVPMSRSAGCKFVGPAQP